MHDQPISDSISALGQDASEEILGDIRERLRKRFDLSGET